MIYREVGQFKTSYAADEAIFPIRQDRALALAALAIAYLVIPAVGSEYWLLTIIIPFLVYALAALGLNLLTGIAGQQVEPERRKRIDEKRDHDRQEPVFRAHRRDHEIGDGERRERERPVLADRKDRLVGGVAGLELADLAVNHPVDPKENKALAQRTQRLRSGRGEILSITLRTPRIPLR